ncbi:MAG: hypothetical protein K0R44_17 [Thermomicrobiales bacterium]|jgi:hypothetical protein|nr:hypothetical protein [Thermomicrobiales bacterium]MDF3014792.1 hypothetical protein [Thermomicrobiales bacterium]
MPEQEASIGGVPYCHPRDAVRRTCYMEQSYEMSLNGTYPTVKAAFWKKGAGC